MQRRGFVSVGLRYVGSVVERQPGFHRLAREADGSVVEATPETTTPARPPVRFDRGR